ncbi:MAG: flagellar filament capping protein FliD [candidate division FCPU426 bacterium]
MSSNSIYISGLASGIDTESMITKLMELERRPQLMVQQKVNLLTAKQGVYSSLKTKLAALESAVQTLNEAGNLFFRQKIASSSDTAVASAAVTGSNPAQGSYQLQVTQLASAAMVTGTALYTGADAQALPASLASSASIAAPSQTVDPSQALSTQAAFMAVTPDSLGTIEINGRTVAWDDNMSLNEIIGRINSSGAGVTAAFDAVAQTISLVTQETGATASLTVSESAGNLWEALQITPGTASGSDAQSPSLTEPLGDAAANLDIAVTSGTFTLNGVVFYVDAATDTLQTVLNRINASSAGVNAGYDEETGAVSLVQTETGSGAEIVLGASGDSSNLLYALKLSGNNPPVGGAGDTYQGTDAMVSVNGGTAQAYSSNTLAGVIPGVKVTLTGTGSTTVSVSADTDAMLGSIKDFVEKYNAVISYIHSKTNEKRAEDPSTIAELMQGTWVSDPLFLETKDQLTQIVGSAVSGLPGDMNQLAQLGITTTSDDFGKKPLLELDENDLREALLADPDGVAGVFNTTDTGIMTQLAAKLENMTDIVSGSFVLEDQALTEQMDVLNKQIQAMEERLVKRESIMRNQFTQMETAVARLNAMGSQLAGLLTITNN